MRRGPLWAEAPQRYVVKTTNEEMPMGYAGSCALLQLEHLAQPIDDVVDPARVDGGVVDDERDLSRHVDIADAVVGEERYPQPELLSLLRDVRSLEIGSHSEEEVRSRRVLLDRRPACERAFPKRLQQSLPFLAVEVAHAVHMPLEGARIDEFRQRELFEARYRARIESLLVAVGIHQFGRKHHVADAHWLDGMPCDRFVTLHGNSPEAISWTIRLEPHPAACYEQVRRAWMAGFLSAARIALEASGDGSYRIAKEA